MTHISSYFRQEEITVRNSGSTVVNLLYRMCVLYTAAHHVLLLDIFALHMRYCIQRMHKSIAVVEINGS